MTGRHKLHAGFRKRYDPPVPTWDQINDARESGLLALSRELADRFLQGQPNDIAVLSLQIENLIDLSLHEEAEQLMARALPLASPEMAPWIWGRRGFRYEVMGKLDQAVEAYLQAHDLNTRDAGPLIRAGAASLRAGAFSIAVDFHTRATLCEEGPIAEAYFHLAGCLMTQRRYPEARQCCSHALEIDPHYEAAKRCLDDIERALLLRHAETVSLHLMPPR